MGVTKNANRFQAMITLGDRKRYIGTYASAEEAARAFDKHSIVLRGLKVREKRRETCRGPRILDTQRSKFLTC